MSTIHCSRENVSDRTLKAKEGGGFSGAAIAVGRIKARPMTGYVSLTMVSEGYNTTRSRIGEDDRPIPRKKLMILSQCVGPS